MTVRPESPVSPSERETQNRVIQLFTGKLGYTYLGDWTRRAGNSNIEEDLLATYLKEAGYTPHQISLALHQLRVAANDSHRDLYHNNKAVYELLRFGVDVKTEAGRPVDNVKLINWGAPLQNHFALAEEVTLEGDHERRPDLVLYLNGLAVGVIELKNSRVDVGQGIRQSLSNQKDEFHAWFFTTVQFVFAGNDSQGLRYGTIETPEKYFLTWKENEADNARLKLDKYLPLLCDKERLIELMRDFVVFDGGRKKLPRHHQYFGVKAAQEHVERREGGIIWHTQGSGKSLVMVFLARWILENNPQARVAVITDRDELDKQIEDVFRDAGEEIVRCESGTELLRHLGQAKPRLLCSLIHKFGLRGPGGGKIDNFEAFIQDLEAQPKQTVGEIFVFIDECHRTQGGKLNRLMKAVLPGAVFIGFTGTPLLKKDAKTSREVFGGYIHTYKYNEAVEDGIILDLVYEARDIDQRLGSEEKIDAWFEAKTRGLNDWQKEELKSKWGTMQRVLSSRSRMDRVVRDVIFDFGTRPRLLSDRGNAILVASSIYEACKYFTLFEKTLFKRRCAVVTSYNPQSRDVTTEEVGAHTETDKQFIYNTYNALLKDVQARPGKTKTETYEETSRKRFIEEPAQMRLLIVVDKLLTGFDAPPCTYLYIDKSMQDHGLFQAICRTNRLDGPDKPFGVIVDYKDLFKKVENVMAVYTSELDHSAGGPSPEVMLKDRLTKGRERLDNALETLALLCEPIEPPRGELEVQHYFCGNSEIKSDLEERAPRRVALYKATVALLRAYANIADDLEAAGYGPAEIRRLQDDLRHYRDLRDTVRNASGESLDLKPYEADMRHLIDTYIEADEPRKISPFDEMGLLDLIVDSGIATAIAERLGGLKGNKDAIAEAIENNVRRKIIREHLSDPAYWEKMSQLLDEIIAARRSKALAYEEYLKKIAELAKRTQKRDEDDLHAELRGRPERQAIYNNLQNPTRGQNEIHQPPLPSFDTTGDPWLDLTLKLDGAVRQARLDDWRGFQAKEMKIKEALYRILGDLAEAERIFEIVKAQDAY